MGSYEVQDSSLRRPKIDALGTVTDPNPQSNPIKVVTRSPESHESRDLVTRMGLLGW